MCGSKLNFFSIWGDFCRNMIRCNNRWLFSSDPAYFWRQCGVYLLKISRMGGSLRARITVFAQIVKCKSVNCCTPFRPSYLTIIKERFLPLPVPISHNNGVMKWVKRDSVAKLMFLYDTKETWNNRNTFCNIFH